MKIELKCKCGAEIVLNDERGSYALSGGERDKHGRMYIVEVAADRWLEIHKACLENPPKEHI